MHHTQPGYIDTHSKLGRGKVTFWQICTAIKKIQISLMGCSVAVYICFSDYDDLSLVGCYAT